MSGRKTPIGPLAGHYKNPILLFGLGSNFFAFLLTTFFEIAVCFLFRQQRLENLKCLSRNVVLVDWLNIG